MSKRHNSTGPILTKHCNQSFEVFSSVQIAYWLRLQGNNNINATTLCRKKKKTLKEGKQTDGDHCSGICNQAHN